MHAEDARRGRRDDQDGDPEAVEVDLRDGDEREHGGGGQQEPGDGKPRPCEPSQQVRLVERVHRLDYLTRVTRRKMGRYIATTKPPITTPRKTIISGSSSAVSAPTAVSTSSS